MKTIWSIIFDDVYNLTNIAIFLIVFFVTWIFSTFYGACAATFAVFVLVVIGAYVKVSLKEYEENENEE